jgi:hypothetical protein
MPGYRRRAAAAELAGMLAELREHQTLGGRAVESWRPPVVSEDQLTLELVVTFAPVASHSPYFTAAPVVEYFQFPALGVAALEREQERAKRGGKTEAAHEHSA